MDWAPLVTEVRDLLATVLLAAGVYGIKIGISYLKARVQEQQDSALKSIYAIAIAAAEQQFGGGAGAQKLDWVTGYLHGKGVTVDRDLLEAMVYEVTGR